VSSTAGLFDTNILIDHLNGISEATACIKFYTPRFISIVTWMEVLAGADRLDEAQVRILLLDFTLIHIDTAVAERAALIRRETRLKLFDAIILATAEVEELTLLTRDAKDFKFDHPNIRIPYRL
jgi:predicted nucleic acid-binding protein